MNLDYAFGPIVATDTVLNINVQFHRVLNRQAGGDEFGRGWGWSTDDDDLDYSDVYDIDSEQAIRALCDALSDRLRDEVESWREAHPTLAAKDRADAEAAGIRL